MHYPEGSIYMHNPRPNDLTPDQFRGDMRKCRPWGPCLSSHNAWNDRKDIMTARSWHPGGVNVALCDASVRPVVSAGDHDRRSRALPRPCRAEQGLAVQ